MDDEDEDRLWDEATQGIKPFKDRAKPPPRIRKDIGAGALEPSYTVSISNPACPIRTPRDDLKGRGLDARTEERLRKGQMRIEARIDLHGYVLAQAEAALKDFIVRAYARRLRCVLVITGKGGAKHDKPWYEGTGGSIQSLTPGWLNAPALKDMILKTAPAQPKDGGSGALYVLLRRQRDKVNY